MIKRITALLILMTIIMSIPVFAVPSDLWNGDERIEALYGVETEDVNYDIIQNLLDYLDIIDIDSFNAKKRAGYSEYIRGIATIAGIYNEDMSEAQLISCLKESDYIQADKTSTHLTIEDVIYSGLRLTGIYYKVDLRSGNIANYLSVAQKYGILNNISYSNAEPLTSGDLAQMLYNIISVPSIEGSSFRWDEGISGLKNDKPLLEKYFNIILHKGIITAVYGMGLYGESRLNKNEVEIDKVRYNALDSDALNPYLGQAVACFIHISDEYKNGNVLFAEPIKDENEIINISAEDITKIDSDEIEFYNQADDSKTIKVNSSTRVIFNGVSAGSYSVAVAEKYIFSNASISAIDHNSDAIADVLMIWKYSSYPVMFDVPETGTLKFKYGLTFEGAEAISLIDDGNNVTEIIYNGQTIEPTDIKANDIVSIARSNNKYGRKHTRILVSRKTVSGTIEVISTEGTKTVSTIQGTEYRLSDEYENASKNTSVNNDLMVPKPDLTAVFALSETGEICDIISSRQYNYGYIISMNTGKGFDTNAQIKMLTEYDKIEVLDLKDEVILYNSQNMAGKTLKEIDAVSTIRAENPDDPRYMVQYKTNTAGEITEIYMVVDNTSNAPGTIDYPMTLDYYRVSDTTYNAYYYLGIMQFKYRCDPNNMPLFCVPPVELADDETLYKIKRIDYKGTNDYLQGVSLYGVDEYYNVEAAMTYEGSMQMDYYLPLMVVDKVTEKMDTNGTQCVSVYGWQDNKYQSYLCEDIELKSDGASGWFDAVGISDLKFGDIVQLNVSGSEKIISMRVLFRGSQLGQFRYQINEGTAGVWGASHYKLNIFYGEAVGVKGDMILIDTSNISGTSEKSSHLINSNTQFYLIESRKIRPVSKSEIVSGDKIVLHKRYTTVYNAFIYR